jgi:hypothetical protein
MSFGPSNLKKLNIFAPNHSMQEIYQLALSQLFTMSAPVFTPVSPRSPPPPAPAPAPAPPAPSRNRDPSGSTFVPTSIHHVSTMLPRGFPIPVSVPEWHPDRRLLEAIELLSYVHDRRNYDAAGVNIYEVQERLNRAIEDMISFNFMQSTNERWLRMTGRPPMWVPHTQSAISVTFATEVNPEPRPARAVQVTQPARAVIPSESKVISKKQLEESCPTECAICQETPKYKDAVCTDCNHYYCKACWDVWMDTPRSNRACPTCRNASPKTTTFRMRASPKSKSAEGKVK